MNEIVNITNGTASTMSSIEIAELCDKRHDNVMRDIKTMLDALEMNVLNFEGIYIDGRGREQKCFNLPRDLTMTLVTGYSIPLRKRVIDRLDELEQRVQQPADPVAMLNDPAAMRGILLSYTEKVIELEAKVEAAKPKTEFYDNYLNADGLYGLQNAARALNCRPNLFIRWLKENYLFYQGGNLVARIQHIQNGNFEVRTTLVEDKVRPQAFITPKGLKYLDERVPENVRVRAA